jgi:hypothetical protein
MKRFGRLRHADETRIGFPLCRRCLHEVAIRVSETDSILLAFGSTLLAEILRLGRSVCPSSWRSSELWKVRLCIRQV